MLAPQPLSATVFVNNGTGDWFNPADWNLGVPDLTEIAIVNNSGTARADSTSPFYPGLGTDAETDDLVIGLRVTLTPVGATGEGTVEMGAVDLNVGGDLQVGRVDLLVPAVNNDAMGTLTTTGGANAPGDVTVGGVAEFGKFVSGPATETATGVGNVAGNFTGPGGIIGLFSVGETESAGDGDGSLIIGGNLSGFNGMSVARSSFGSTGNATGFLSVGGGVTGPEGFVVGSIQAAGTAVGEAQVGTNLAGTGISDVFFVGVGFGGSTSDIGSVGVGQLSVFTGGVTGNGNFSELAVGKTIGNGGVDGTANITGTIGGFPDINVGVAEDGIGSAKGELNVFGDIQGDGSQMQVGNTDGIGTGQGVADVTGNLGGFFSTNVGFTDSTSTGDATGELIVGGAVRNSLFLGVARGAGEASGKANLNQGLLFGEDVFVGVSSSLSSTAMATGELVVQGGGVSSASGESFLVGTTSGAGSAMGTADVSGGIVGYAGNRVGVVSGAGSTGNATGDLKVIGNVVARDASFPVNLEIGVTQGAGRAIGKMELTGDLDEFSSIFVGFSDETATGSAQGELTMGGEILGGLQIFVGRVSGAGTAVGSAQINGAGPSSLSSFQVGVAETTSSLGAVAVGDLTVAGGLTTGGISESLIVGRTRGNGTAIGTANITGGLSNFEFIDVGSTRGPGGLGSAFGHLILTGGTATTDFMAVGERLGLIGTADGRLTLDEILLTVNDELTFGVGSTLEMVMDGTNRGIDFAAIDAAEVMLNGALEVLFTFQPAAMMAFDLIISGSSDGILGDFTSVDIMGLTDGTMVTSGFVLDNFGMGPVEVYRLVIGEVVVTPEPGTLWIFAIGLLGVILVVRPRAVRGT
ncbi:MAG: PEP-CTERM sorting domain-containing protein [Pseudomonadota bacterium]